MTVPTVRILIKFMTQLSSVQLFYFVVVYIVNPLLSPPGGLFISNTFEKGGLIEMGGGGLFNLAKMMVKMMVSVVHKEL